MPGPIPQYNTTEVLPFKMVSAADSVTPVLGLVAGLDLFVTISKNGGAFAAPAGTVSEVGEGWYAIAPNAVDANTAGPLVLNAVGTACDPADAIFDVQERAAPGVPVAPVAAAGPVGTRLSLDLGSVKLYLRVDTDDDDDLISTLINSAKQRADDFLQNPFTEERRIVGINGAVAKEGVTIDGIGFIAVAVPPADADRTQEDEAQQFQLGATDADTATNLAAIVNDATWGAPRVVASADGTEVSLRWRDGRTSPVTASSSALSFRLVVRRVDSDIPESIRVGVLRTIAAWYDQRQDGVGAAGISGLSSTTYETPESAGALWAPYRSYKGL
jgi:hypothetical protein